MLSNENPFLELVLDNNKPVSHIRDLLHLLVCISENKQQRFSKFGSMGSRVRMYACSNSQTTDDTCGLIADKSETEGFFISKEIVKQREKGRGKKELRESN